MTIHLVSWETNSKSKSTQVITCGKAVTPLFIYLFMILDDYPLSIVGKKIKIKIYPGHYMW
jgi:hypothetical protein